MRAVFDLCIQCIWLRNEKRWRLTLHSINADIFIERLAERHLRRTDVWRSAEKQMHGIFHFKRGGGSN